MPFLINPLKTGVLMATSIQSFVHDPQTFLQYSLVILKHSLHNYKRILKKCFLCTTCIVICLLCSSTRHYKVNICEFNFQFYDSHWCVFYWKIPWFGMWISDTLTCGNVKQHDAVVYSFVIVCSLHKVVLCTCCSKSKHEDFVFGPFGGG